MSKTSLALVVGVPMPASTMNRGSRKISDRGRESCARKLELFVSDLVNEIKLEARILEVLMSLWNASMSERLELCKGKYGESLYMSFEVKPFDIQRR